MHFQLPVLFCLASNLISFSEQFVAIKLLLRLKKNRNEPFRSLCLKTDLSIFLKAKKFLIQLRQHFNSLMLFSTQRYINFTSLQRTNKSADNTDKNSVSFKIIEEKYNKNFKIWKQSHASRLSGNKCGIYVF